MNSKLFINQISEGFEQSIDDVINTVDGLNHQLLNTLEGEKNGVCFNASSKCPLLRTYMSKTFLSC